MKKVTKLLVMVLTVAILFSLFTVGSAMAEEADFTMDKPVYELLASDIITKAEFGEDPTKFNREGHIVAASGDGKLFWHSGNGDSFTFTVNFGTYEVSKMSYTTNSAMTLNVYANGELVGEGISSAPGTCKFDLKKALTGLQTIKVEVVHERNVWPGPDYGNITFIAESRFIMDNATFNTSAKDIILMSDFGEDPAKFNREGHTVCASDDGQLFWHSGNGDSFTFTVDFGAYDVDKMSYTTNSAMTLNVYANGEHIGEGISSGSGTCKFDLNKKLTGVKTIKIEVIHERNVWPGPDYGNITFFSSEKHYFTMTDATFNILAKDILTHGVHTSDSSKFDRRPYGGVEVSPDGQIFWHSGNGDTFEFNVDFGSKEVDKMSFNYGGPAMTLNVYVDGVLTAQGVAPESSRDVNANKCEITFDEALTGKHTIKYEVVSDTVVWPGTDYGMFAFYEKVTTPENPGETPENPGETPENPDDTPDNPNTGDNNMFVVTTLCLMTMVAATIVVSYRKKENQ